MDQGHNLPTRALGRGVSRRSLVVGSAYAAVGLGIPGLLSACSSAKDTPGNAGASDQPKKGGVLTVNFSSDPPNFDPISNTTSRVLNVAALTYSSLLMFDTQQPDKIVGDIAEKWESSSDGLEYTFNLIKNAKFHDGLPVTSADVKFSLDYIRNPPADVTSPRQEALAAVESVETPDEYTVLVRLSRPSPSFLANLASAWMFIVPKHVVEAKGNLEQTVIGSGPYKFKEYVPGTSVELVRNENYHVPSQPYLDGIQFFVIPDPATAMAQFRAGRLLFFDSLQSEDALVAQKEFGEKVTIQTTIGQSSAQLILNSKKAPFNDLRVRQAISHAIDRADAVKVLRGTEASLGGIMPPGPWELPQARLAELPGFNTDREADLATARRLLAEAGHENGFEMVLTTRRQATFEEIAVWTQSQLAKIGIKVRIDFQDSAAMNDILVDGNFQMAAASQSISLNDPDSVFGEQYVSTAARNYSGISSAEVDELYQQQSQTTDPAQRKKLVDDMQVAAHNESGRILLYHSLRYYGFTNRLQNFKAHPVQDNNWRFRDVWLA